MRSVVKKHTAYHNNPLKYFKRNVILKPVSIFVCLEKRLRRFLNNKLEIYIIFKYEIDILINVILLNKIDNFIER
jgi:hypothetical protein